MLWVGPRMRPLKSVVFWELIVSPSAVERYDHSGAERACSHRANAATSPTRALPGAGGPLRARDRRAPGESARRSRRIAASPAGAGEEGERAPTVGESTPGTPSSRS